jgi:hypothetical protein
LVKLVVEIRGVNSGRARASLRGNHHASDELRDQRQTSEGDRERRPSRRVRYAGERDSTAGAAVGVRLLDNVPPDRSGRRGRRTIAGAVFAAIEFF